MSWNTTEESLRDAFSQCGEVVSAQVIMDRMSGRSKGFGFVEMGTQEEADAAIAKFNGADLDGRALTVNEARPMEERPQRPDRGGAGGSRGGAGRW
jgi:RNA recognition motif-containing protein